MLRLVLPALSALLLTPAVAAGAPAPGTFSGSLGLSVPKGAQAEVRAINRADGSVERVRTASRSGAFTLSLPAGQYLVVGAVVPRRGKASALKQTQVAVSLKAGQQRTKTRLTARKKKAKKRTARRRSARASYVQERGQVTPGSVAVEIHPFTGATGEMAVLNKGMADLLITDVVGTGGAGDDCNVTVLEVERRGDVLKELELQQSPYFDPATRVQRNFVLGDVEVRGTLRNGPGDATLGYDVRLIDKRDGTEVGRLTGTMDAGDLFAAEEQFAKQLNEELCKLSDTYEVTLHVDGAANFATHSAGGTLDAKLKAKRAGKKSPIWRGTGPLAWAGTSYTSKIPPCTYTDPVEPAADWNVTITNLGNGDLLVEWAPGHLQIATATVVCPSDDGPPAIIPGQPGPSLLQTAPEKFQMPVAGGVQALSGGFRDGGDGWFNTGTITVRPSGVARME